MSLKPFVLVIATLCVNLASGQVHTDTLSIKLDSAEKLFLGGNFILLPRNIISRRKKRWRFRQSSIPIQIFRFTIVYTIPKPKNSFLLAMEPAVENYPDRFHNLFTWRDKEINRSKLQKQIRDLPNTSSTI